MVNNQILEIKPLGFPWETQDPFLFCAHHRDEYPQGNKNMGVSVEELNGRHIGSDFTLKHGWRMYHGTTIPGFPYHPHRGFETITINKEGFVDHSDSLGGAGRFGSGDVQWMTAGKGIQHSEMFPLINQDKPNPLEIFQIWLNLPASKKMVDPHFKMLWNSDIPLVVEEDLNQNKTEINIISGQYLNVNAPKPTPDSWANDLNNGVRILTVKLHKNAEWTLPKSIYQVNRNIYFYRGNQLKVNGVNIPNYHRVELNSDEDILLSAGREDCFILVLEGRPIKEPVVQHGPYVMNTNEEIRQTMKEYQKTLFGGWPWPKREQVHALNKGRFALHADGKLENKP